MAYDFVGNVLLIGAFSLVFIIFSIPMQAPSYGLPFEPETLRFSRLILSPTYPLDPPNDYVMFWIKSVVRIER